MLVMLHFLLLLLGSELEKEFGRDRGEGIVSLCWKGGKVNGGISTGVRGGIWRQEG